MTSSSDVASAHVVFLPLVGWLLVGPGCAGPQPSGQDAGPGACARGLRAMGPACVPVFDPCKDDEVALQGGGCKRVGVQECLQGWGLMEPPDWRCKPVGPPRTCLKGWARVKGGWCEPVLPKGPCPKGTMTRLGAATCQPIGDCGTGT